jgi:molecular chaperone GrpE
VAKAKETPNEEDFKVQDRRHWTQADDPEAAEPADVAPARGGILDEFRLRAEAAERKLLEYIEAFKGHQRDQDAFRERIQRDVERQAGLRFADLVADLLPLLDDLERSLTHAERIAPARPLVEGVAMARDRFLDALARQGVERVVPDGAPFDPLLAEALRVDPVDRPDLDGTVVETLQAGYRLGDRVLRPARVVVGRYSAD